MKMMLLSLIITSLAIIINAQLYENVVVIIPAQKLPKAIVGNEFFSAALDTSVVASHFQNFDMSNEQLINLVKKLKLGYLRIGGNMADRLYFDSHEFPLFETHTTSSLNYSCIFDELHDCVQDFPNFTMSALEWINLNNFAKKVGATILFDLNCLIRNDDGSWDSSNAEKLISFSADRKFKIDWQLGNEPNAFKHVFNYEVNATQLAKDFVILRGILNKFDLYKDSYVVGPDVTRPQPEHKQSIKYLKEFLKEIRNKHTLNAVAFHQYYLNGRTSTIGDFLNPHTFDLLDNQIQIIINIMKNSGLSIPIWLSMIISRELLIGTAETSTAYGGGAKGLSNTFVGSFLWLDKLGLAAKNGIKTVVRQSLFHDYYALIDNNYNPTPDWWLSYFYNKFVGIEALECKLSGSATLRVYCHCARGKESHVTVFGINLFNASTIVHYQQQSNKSSDAYVFTSDGTLVSKNVLINNKKMILSDDGNVPNVPPITIYGNQNLTIPPYSLFFWLVPYQVEACRKPIVTFF